MSGARSSIEDDRWPPRSMLSMRTKVALGCTLFFLFMGLVAYANLPNGARALGLTTHNETLIENESQPPEQEEPELEDEPPQEQVEDEPPQEQVEEGPHQEQVEEEPHQEQAEEETQNEEGEEGFSEEDYTMDQEIPQEPLVDGQPPEATKAQYVTLFCEDFDLLADFRVLDHISPNNTRIFSPFYGYPGLFRGVTLSGGYLFVTIPSRAWPDWCRDRGCGMSVNWEPEPFWVEGIDWQSSWRPPIWIEMRLRLGGTNGGQPIGTQTWGQKEMKILDELTQTWSSTSRYTSSRGNWFEFRNYGSGSEETMRGLWATLNHSGTRFMEPVEGVDVTEWHTYSFFWDVDKAAFLVDGDIVALVPGLRMEANRYFVPRFSVSNAIQGATEDGQESHGYTDIVEDEWMQIDYIRIFADSETAHAYPVYTVSPMRELLPLFSVALDTIEKAEAEGNHIPILNAMKDNYAKASELFVAELELVEILSEKTYRGWYILKHLKQPIRDPETGEIRDWDLWFREMARNQTMNQIQVLLEHVLIPAKTVFGIEVPENTFPSPVYELFFAAYSAIEDAETKDIHQPILNGMIHNYETALREPWNAEDHLQAVLDQAQTYFDIEVVEPVLLPILVFILLPTILSRCVIWVKREESVNDLYFCGIEGNV